MSDRLRRSAALLAVTALVAAAGCGGGDAPANSGKATSTPSGGKSKPNGY